VPFKPTAGKPIFCDNCFRQEGGGSKGSRSKDSGEVMEQLKQLNIKIDELMKILTPKPKIKKIEAVKEVTKTKPKTKTTKSKK